MNAAHFTRACVGLVVAGLAVAGVVYAAGSVTGSTAPETELPVLSAVPTVDKPVNTDRDGRDPWTEPLGSKATPLKLAKPYDWERDGRHLPDATATPADPDADAPVQMIEPESADMDYRTELYADRGASTGSVNPPKPIGIDRELLAKCLAAAPAEDSPGREAFMLSCIGATMTTGS